MQGPRHIPNFANRPFQSPFRDTRLHARFRGAVLDYFAKRNRPVRLLSDLTLLEPDGARHGLWNLAQICRMNPVQSWPQLVAAHLDKSDRKVLTAAVQELTDGTFEDFAGRLSIRIHPQELIDRNTRGAVVYRTDLPETISLLVLDLGESVTSLPVPIADQWGVPHEQLFARALQNLAAEPCPNHASFIPGTPPVPFDTMIGGHCTSSQLLCDGGLPRLGKHGNLVAVPRRDALLSLPIDHLPSMDPIEAMEVLAAVLYRTGPGSITPHLYWRTPDGQYQLQRTSQDEQGFHLAMTFDFGTLVHSLLPQDR